MANTAFFRPQMQISWQVQLQFVNLAVLFLKAQHFMNLAAHILGQKKRLANLEAHMFPACVCSFMSCVSALTCVLSYFCSQHCVLSALLCGVSFVCSHSMCAVICVCVCSHAFAHKCLLSCVCSQLCSWLLCVLSCFCFHIRALSYLC